MGDVIRDIPRALAVQGHDVTVLVPGYQHFSRLPGAKLDSVLEVAFRHGGERVELWSLPADPAHPGVHCQVLEHPLLAPCGPGRIYCDDGPGRPFATDASKFALFCAAVATGLRDGVLQRPDRVHLHDWHTALVPVLAHESPWPTQSELDAIIKTATDKARTNKQAAKDGINGQLQDRIANLERLLGVRD
jgi:starch synthase